MAHAGRAELVQPDVVEAPTVLHPRVGLVDWQPAVASRQAVCNHSLYDAWKRVVDLLASTTLLGMTAPLFAVIAFLIKMTSRGSVFFRQSRVGKDGKPFLMWKFRTMVEDAEKMRSQVGCTEEPEGKPQCGYFKLREDPRVTRMGRVLRRLSLDELPQLINVLEGNMSLMGPRPLVWEDVDLDDPRMRERCEVLPGLTGLWQINGRSDIAGDHALMLDLQYVRRRSVGLDLKILLMTPFVMLTGRGAY